MEFIAKESEERKLIRKKIMNKRAFWLNRTNGILEGRPGCHLGVGGGGEIWSDTQGDQASRVRIFAKMT